MSRVNRLRLANGIPMAIENAVIPSRVLPDPSLVKQSLTPCCTTRASCRRALCRELHAVLLTEEQASCSALPRKALRCISNAAPSRPAGEVVEFTSSYYRGDAYDFVAELTISQPERMQNDDA